LNNSKILILLGSWADKLKKFWPDFKTEQTNIRQFMILTYLIFIELLFNYSVNYQLYFSLKAL
jgi:hypothetical protein